MLRKKLVIGAVLYQSIQKSKIAIVIVFDDLTHGVNAKYKKITNKSVEKPGILKASYDVIKPISVDLMR